MATLSLLKSVFTSGDYYVSMNMALKAINGNYHMLHYPFHVKDTSSFAEAQENLINYCMERVPEVKDKNVLDVGCGNGLVAMYLAEKYELKSMIGIDLNENNIKIACDERQRRKIEIANFLHDNAQKLENIKEGSVDLIINIESAFHYPNKDQFLKAIHRVLKPGDHFLIADILTTRKRKRLLSKWKKKMNYHHWSYDDYIEGFGNAGLKLITEDDISEHIIRGYRDCMHFMKDVAPDSRINRIILKIFFQINIALNSYLLRNKRRYYVFCGTK